jgi:hypothetical protein
LLVDFGDTDGFKKSLLHLIENPEECDNMRKKAYDFGREMTWQNVGGEYNTIFSTVLRNENIDPKVQKIFSFHSEQAV